ncbi:rRNA N-glycosidase [Hordeum vulgare]|nr:rRNA N-glycosidase [Hordeum vulgare]
MTKEEEARLVQRVMEDSMNTYDERQWVGLEEMLALSVAGDMAILELEMADAIEDQPVAVKEEVHEEQPVAALPQIWWANAGRGRARQWRWPRKRGPSLGAPRRRGHRARVVTTRGGGVGAASGANHPGAAGPPLDDAAVHRPRWRR